MLSKQKYTCASFGMQKASGAQMCTMLDRKPTPRWLLMYALTACSTTLAVSASLSFSDSF